MEQRNNVLTAVIALVALVIGVFVGMSVQGGGLQGKLTLSKDSSARCEEYKSMLLAGNLTDSLGKEKAYKAMKFCQDNFPAFWNASPTASECSSLRKRVDYYGGSEGFSKFLTKSGLSPSNAQYCGQVYPFMWYGIGVEEYECYQYKWFFGKGGNLSKLLGGDNATKAVTDCQNYENFNWWSDNE